MRVKDLIRESQLIFFFTGDCIFVFRYPGIEIESALHDQKVCVLKEKRSTAPDVQTEQIGV